MRLWFSGSRLLGVVRPGVSFTLRGGMFRAQPRAGDFVYVIEGEHGHVKIGVSRDPVARLATLQTGSSVPIGLAWREFAGDRAFEIEQEAHAMLARHRLAGEWFDVPREAAIGAVYGAAYRLGAPLGVPRFDGPTPWRSFALGAVALFAAGGIASLATSAYATPLMIVGAIFAIMAIRG